MADAGRILIAGGGIAGLSPAIALRRHGAAAELVERSPAWPADQMLRNRYRPLIQPPSQLQAQCRNRAREPASACGLALSTALSASSPVAASPQPASPQPRGPEPSRPPPRRVPLSPRHRPAENTTLTEHPVMKPPDGKESGLLRHTHRRLSAPLSSALRSVGDPGHEQAGAQAVCLCIGGRA
jgi:hypothetical protein